MIEKYLEDIEQHINPEVEDQLISEWMDFNNGDCTGDIFVPERCSAFQSGVEWPYIGVNDTLTDMELMLLQEVSWSVSLAKGSGALLHARTNYGPSTADA